MNKVFISVNLDNYYPLDIIELYYQNLITLDEVILSRRWVDEIGNDLKQLIVNEFRAHGMRTTIADEYSKLLALKACPDDTLIKSA